MIQTLRDFITAPVEDKLVQQETSTIEVSDNSLSSSPNTSICSNYLPNDYFDSIIYTFTSNINDGTLNQQSDYLFDDFNEALNENSSITMLPNYNINPTGEEYGDFLIIDLGGSTLRIAIIRIEPPSASTNRNERVKIVVEKNWTIVNSFKVLNYNFFRWIGDRILETIKEQNIISKANLIKTGITWSFPLETTSHCSGNIIYVSKGYTISDEIYSKDLKTLLETVLKDEFSLRIDVKVIINDSLAVYAAGSFLDRFMKLAIVLGTGFNMCCSLKTSKIHYEKTLKNDAVLLNAELSLFGHNFIKDFSTKYDQLIDERFKLIENLHFKPFMSIDPLNQELFQPSEMMTSGRYLPELTRLVLVDLIEMGEVFKGVKNLSKIYKKYDGFSGELMCFIDETNDYNLIFSKLNEEFNWSINDILINDITILKRLINCVIKRASFIVAVTIVSCIKLLKCHNDEQDLKILNIGYVGSVLNYFNNYRTLIKNFVNENDEIKKLGIKVDFKLIENSSIIGAAIGAAYYS